MPTRKNPSSHRPTNAHRRQQRRAVEEHERELRARAPHSVVASSEDEVSPRPRARAQTRYGRKPSTPIWKRLRIIALFLLLIGLGQVVIASLSSPQFRVADVTVSGAQITDADEIARAQQSLVGQNWVRAQTGAAVKQISSLPTVKSVSVSRALHWPPHLHIAITERAPFARVGAGENWWIVDESGVPFRREQKSDSDAKLFAVTNPKFAPDLGQPLSKENWEPTKKLVSDLSAQKESWPLRRIYFDKNGFASLRLQGGKHDEMLIRLGGDRWPEKLDRARQALEYFDRTNQRASTLNLVSYIMPQWTPIRPVQASSTPVETALAPDA